MSAAWGPQQGVKDDVPQQAEDPGAEHTGPDDEGGLADARWRLYRLQTQLQQAISNASADLTICHERGGTISRGGAKTHNVVLGSPPGTVNGLLVVTANGVESVVDLSNVSAVTAADLTVRDGGEIKGQLTTLGGRSSLVSSRDSLLKYFTVS